MNCLEIGSMLLMLRKGYNNYFITNYELVDYMLDEELISINNCMIVITDKGNDYLDDIIENKYLLLLRYISPDPNKFNEMILNRQNNNSSFAKKLVK
mgnify:FL=1